MVSVTFYGGSEDVCLLQWRKSITCGTWCFGNGSFTKEFYVFVPNAISHYGRPSRFALIRFNARRLDYSASLFVPYSLESWISHPKESELNLTTSPFTILIGKRLYDGFEYFRASLIHFTKWTPR